METVVPSEFYLGQNYPNPFSGETTIKFCVAQKARVTLDILSAGYQMIVRLVDEECDAGTYEATFDASDLPEGNYVYIMQAADHVITKRMSVER